jgi:hypothetical protein
MKKVFLAMAFSAVIAANATNDKESVTNTIQDVPIQKMEVTKVIKFEKVSIEENENLTSEVELLFGCGSQGNIEYDNWRDQGYSHREARELRRAFVRDCRGFPDTGWLLFPWPFSAFN